LSFLTSADAVCAAYITKYVEERKRFVGTL